MAMSFEMRPKSEENIGERFPRWSWRIGGDPRH
jgi:hypothetical protein